MTVYVDDYCAPYGRMKMCHLIADSDAELLVMVDRIGVERRHWQSTNSHKSHFDICLSKRSQAIACGAVAITSRQAAAMVRRRAVTGSLGLPGDALAWLSDQRRPQHG